MSAADRRRAAGLCVRCGDPAVPGRVRCRPCLDRAAAGVRRLRDRRRADGLCMDCDSLAAPGRRFCRPCLDRAAAGVRRRRAAGLCGCGDPVEPGRSRCGRCLAADGRVSMSRYHRRRAAGLCGGCGDPAEPGRSRCRPCLDRVAAGVRRHRAAGS